MHRHLVLIGTGGTIAATANAAQQLTDYTVTQGIAAMLAAVPGAHELADIHCEQLFNIDSRAMGSAQVLRLARRIEQHLKSGAVDGIVVTHGTDTLEETAFLLHLTLQCQVPVVLVGAMRPGSALSADGPLNLYNALLVACDPASQARGVLVAMNDTIVSARAALKLSTTQVQAFGVDGTGVLGSITDRVVRYWARPDVPANPLCSLKGLRRLPAVDLILDYQDAPLHPYQAAIAAGASGIVVAGMGNGSLSSAAERGCRLATRHGLVCIRASRVPRGAVTLKSSDHDTGLLAAGALNALQARTVLRLALAQHWGTEQIRETLQRL
ncbi:MAG TPA: asparaginase [Castellaniella sp.]|uniref:asparaginase n=1 Tax=Castellaniella sp. TaxID=1955812 RepID=UPI002EECDD22